MGALSRQPELAGAQAMPAQDIREPFDRVTQHRARHPCSVLVKEAFKDGRGTVAHLAQRPAASVVQEVVRVCEEVPAQAQRVIELPIANQCLRGDDGNAFFPQALRFREAASASRSRWSNQVPRICGALVSTRSQLLIQRVFAR